MLLYPGEIPVAYSMVRVANSMTSVHSEYEPFQKYLCYWMAFNNVYTTIAARNGDRPHLLRNVDRSLRTHIVEGIGMPKVSTYKELEQIDFAIREISDDLKIRLIKHPSTKYFANRTPMWRRKRIQRDARGNTLNGVINVGYTVDAKHPVWSPITVSWYEDFIRGAEDPTIRDGLAKQVVYLLYTVRNNLVHGGKQADNDNDREVIEQALPLLELVVAHFVSETHFNDYH